MRPSSHYRCGGDNTPLRRRQWSALSTHLTLPLVVLALLMTLVPSAEAAGSTWFVNDTSTVGDAFTSAIGSDSNAGTDTAPFATIAMALQTAAAGDSILIDSGTYFPASTLLIETNGITLMGVDSAGTVIDADWNLETGVAVLGAANLTVRNLRIARVWLDGGLGNNIGIGVALYGAATPRFENVDLTDLGTAIYAFPGTDSLTISGSRFWDNNPEAIGAETSPRISLIGNVFGNPNPNSDGVSLNGGCDSAYIIGNTNIPLTLTDALYCRIENNVTNRDITLGGNSSRGRIYNNRLIANAGGSALTVNGNENEVDSNLIDRTGGTSMTIYGDSNLVTRNIATGPTGGGGVGYGFHVSGGGNILRENVASGKWLNGYRIDGTFNLFETNVASNCGAGSSFDGCGFRLVITGDTNVLVGNVATGNRSAGFSIERGGNVFINNRATGTTDGPGFALAGASSVGNRLVQNLSDSNIGYALSITVNAAGNFFVKNNLLAAATKPDSLVLYNGAATVVLSRHWWGTIDRDGIRAKIKGTGADSVVFSPYRLGVVDTTVNADTVAPNAPASITTAPLDTTTIRVTWAASVGSEEPEAAADLTAYRIWRAASMANAERGALAPLTTVGPGATTYDDGGREPGVTYYYRVTAIDNHSTINESFFSDSRPPGVTLGIQSAEIPEAQTGQYDTVLTGIIGTDTGYSLAQNNVDTVVLGLPNQAGTETWNIEIGFPDTGNQLLIRQVQASEMAASNTSRIEAFAKGQNLTLEIVAFDSTGVERPQSYWATATESPVLTFELGNSGLRPHRATLYWLNTADSVWYDVRHSDSGMSRGQYTRTETMISIPVDHFTHFFPGEGTVDTVTVALADTIQSQPIYSQSAETHLAMAVLMLGDTGATGDTLTRFAIANKGNATDTGVDTVVLWHSSAGATSLSVGDTPIGILTYDAGAGEWRNTALSYFVNWSSGNPETFLVSFRARSTVTTGETFQAYVPASSVKTELEETGPVSGEVVNPGAFTFATGLAARKFLGPQAGFEADSIELADQIWIESGGETMAILSEKETGMPLRIKVLDSSGLGDSVVVALDTSGTGANYVNIGDTAIVGGVGQLDGMVIFAAETNLLRITVYDLTSGATAAIDTGVIFSDLVAPTVTDSSRLINGTDTYARSETVTLTFTSAGVADTGPGGIDRFDVSASDTFGPSPGTWIGASFGDTPYQIPSSAIVNSVATLYFRFFDEAENVSETAVASIRVFTDSNTIYVNDTAAAGDIYTTALGGDDTGTGKPDAPFRSLGFALAIARAGETILVDAGTYYPADTITIETNAITIAGKDSASTVFDFNDTSGDGAIYAANKTNLTLRDFAVQRGNYGIRWNNVDLSTIARVRVDTNGADGIALANGSDSNTLTSNRVSGNEAGDGIFLDGASNNTVTSNVATGNALSGIALDNASNNNTVTSNTVSANGGIGFGEGIRLTFSSNNNVLTSNTVTGNGQSGISLENASNNNILTSNTVSGNPNFGIILSDSSNNNAMISNIVSGNLQLGVFVSNSSNNTFFQNTIDSNADYGIQISGTSSADTFTKNIITPPPSSSDSGVFNSTGNIFDFTRNWWGTNDSDAIRAKINGTGADSIIYSPFRLGIVDTAAGADTVAPNAPDTVAVATVDDSSLLVTWAVSTGSEDPEAAANLTGYRVYRATTADTSSWQFAAQVAQPTASFLDTGLTAFQQYFYRVTAYDNAALVNESYYSDSIVEGMPRNPGPNWYVNDTSLIGDIYASAIGADTGTGSIAKPFLRIDSALAWAVAGETILVDAGTYYPADTITIETNAITIAGKDSASTVIDFNNAAPAGARAIYAANVTGIRLRDLRSINGYNGVWFANTDQSVVERVTASGVGSYGFVTENGSESNTFAGCYATGNTSGGWNLNDTSGFNTLTGNVASGNTGSGFTIWSDSNTLTGNAALTNVPGKGFSCVGASNLFESNTASGNTGIGFEISGAASNTLTGNTSAANTSYGFYLIVANNGRLTGNTSLGNNNHGFYIRQLDGVIAERNVSSNNKATGFYVQQSTNCVLQLNTADSNANWAFSLNNSSSEDTIQKNIIITSPTRPDSGVENATTNIFDVTRNWWNTVDSAAIRAKIGGVGADSVLYSPYRLGLVDTAPGADTIAPKAPDTVAVAGSELSATVSWSASTLDENGAVQTGIHGYRIYRSTDPDTSSWPQIAAVGAGVLQYADNGLTHNETFTYRVTAYDTNAAFGNESFFSDSAPSFFALATGLQTSVHLGPASGEFESDSARLMNLIWIEADGETETILALETTTVPGRIRVHEFTGLADSFSVEIDTGTGTFVFLGDTPIIGAVGELDAVLQLSPETNFIRITVVDTTTGVPSAIETGTIFVDLMPPTIADSSLLIETGAMAVGSETVRLTFTAAGVADTGPGGVRRFDVSDTNSFPAAPGTETSVSFGDTAFFAGYANISETGFTRLYFRFYDDAGNMSSVVSDTIIIDTMPPIAAVLASPADNHDTTATTIAFSWAAAIDTHSGLAEHRLQAATDTSFSALAAETVVGPAVTSAPLTLAGTDTYYWRVVAVDNVGRTTATESRVIRIDTAPPAAFTVTAPGVNHDTNATLIVFRWNLTTDAGAGVDSYTVQIDTAGGVFAVPVAETSVAATADSASLTLAGTETYIWRVVARDKAGNTTPSDSRVLRIDTTPPTAAVPQSPGGDTVLATATVTFVWAPATDTHTALVEHLLQVDTAGAFASLVDSASLGGAIDSTMRTLPANDSYFWRIVARDNAGNTTVSDSARFVIDTAPPTAAQPVAPVQGHETNVLTVTFTWIAGTDALSGIREHRLQADTAGGTYANPVAETTVAGAGASAALTLTNETGVTQYKWRVLAVDSAGNTTASADSTIVIDTLATAALVTPDSGVTQDSRPTFTWTQQSAASFIWQIDTTTLFTTIVDSATTAALSHQATPGLDSGTYYWRVIALDALGNMDTTAARFITIDTGLAASDTTPPDSFTVTGPADNHDTNVTTVVFGWNLTNDTGSGVANYVLQVDTTGGTFAAPVAETTVGAATASAPLTLAGTDTYRWRVMARDAAGNTTATESRLIRIDTTSPAAFTVAAPADSLDTSATTIVFSWNATTDTGAGLASYRLEADTFGGAFAAPVAETTVSAATTSAALTLAGTDTYRWRVVARDNAGNTTTTESRVIRIDTTPPVAAVLVSPAADHDTSATTIIFSWTTAADTHSGLREHRLQIATNASFSALLADSSTGLATAGETTLPANDTYWWRVVAVDTAGNTTTSETRALLIDTTPPVAATLTAPADNLETNAATIAFAWTAATDALSGLLEHRLQIATNAGFSPLLADSSTGLATAAETTLPANDTYWWRVVAVNNAGDTTATAGRSLRIDTAPPTVQVTLLDTAANIIGPRIRIVATDNFGLGESAVYRLTGDLDSAADPTVGQWLAWSSTDTLERTIQLTADSGVKTCTIAVRDRAGNSTETAIQTRYETGAVSYIIQDTATPINFSETTAPAPGETLIYLDSTGDTLVIMDYSSGDSVLQITVSETHLFQDTVLLSAITNLITDTTRPIVLLFGSDSLLLYRPTTAAPPVIQNTIATGETLVRFLPAALITTGETAVFTAVSSTETVQFHIPITDTMKRAMARFELGNLAGGFTDTTNQGFTDVGDKATLQQTVREFRMTDSAGRKIENNDTYFPQGILIAFPVAIGLRDNASLRPFYFRSSDSTWANIFEDTTMVFHTAADSFAFAAGDSTMRVRVRHFTFIGISPVDWAAQAALSNVVVYPNPYVPYDGNAATGIPPASGGGVYIGNLTAGAKIRIFDIRGRLVHEATNGAGGAMLWSARNKDNQEVASGVYLIVVEAGGQRVVKKVAVVR